MSTLTLENLLAAAEYPRVAVEVPEWGGSVNLKPHTLRDTLALETDQESFSKDLHIPIYLSYSLVDDQGRRIITTAEQVENLARHRTDILLDLYYRANALNTREDAKAREKHEESAPADGVPAGGAAGQDGR